MKELSALLENEGYLNVKTYIQSGNVVLQSKQQPKSIIHQLIVDNFDIDALVFSIEASKFYNIIKNNPYQSAQGNTVHFYFCSKTPTVNQEQIEKYIATTETYTIKDDIFYLHAPEGIGRSKLVSNIETCLGVSTTGRNLNTINKLKTMVSNI